MSSLARLVAGLAHEINNPVSLIYGKIVHIAQYVLNLFNLIKIYHKYCGNSVPKSQKM
ncbi:histidine kinase dimerization/phospho-acceptor domain-containing protein [Microcoleus sp. B3-A4]